MYFNTTHLNGKQLHQYEIAAENQDAKILEFFTRNRYIYASAEDLHRMLMPQAPLTSVRRALSNLFKDEFIKKGDQVDGQYGNPIYTWALNI